MNHQNQSDRDSAVASDLPHSPQRAIKRKEIMKIGKVQQTIIKSWVEQQGYGCVILESHITVYTKTPLFFQSVKRVSVVYFKKGITINGYGKPVFNHTLAQLLREVCEASVEVTFRHDEPQCDGGYF